MRFIQLMQTTRFVVFQLANFLFVLLFAQIPHCILVYS